MTSRDYLEGVSDAAYEALIQVLAVNPDGRLQLINQHDLGEMVFNRTTPQ